MLRNHRIAKLCLVIILCLGICVSTLCVLTSNSNAVSSFLSAEGSATFSMDTMDSIAVTEDISVFTNPDKGWYRIYVSDDIWGLDQLKKQGINFILLEVNLAAFKTTPISSAKLDEINSAFASARKSGIQVIFRAAYDFDGQSAPEPKDLSIITGHIAQLKNIFYDNEDVLYCVQAGFLGPWGEWHSSYYGDPPSLNARKTVLFALMDAVPKTRTIQVRRPMFIRDIYANEPGGSTMTEDKAFNQSNLARTGYHDDALLSNADEAGTYVDPAYSRQDELNWVNNQDKYVTFVGETNQLSAYSDPGNAVPELNKLHAQVINIDYYPSVITKWKQTTYNGISMFNYLSMKLGYRFLLTDAKINTVIQKNGVLHLNLSIKNDGLGNLSNERGFEIVLSNGSQTFVAKVSDDPRKWYKENGTMVKDLYFSIPSSIASGSWSVYLNLPSASASLKNNAAYSIRLANAGVWAPDKGYNLIKSGINISTSTTANAVSVFQQISRADAELLDKPMQSPTPTTVPPTVPPTQTPVMTATPKPTNTPTAPPTQTPAVTTTPKPTNTPTAPPTQTPIITVAPTKTPVITATPTTTPKPTVKPTATSTSAPVYVQTMTFSNDSTTLKISVTGLDLAKKSQFYINSDKNNATGYMALWQLTGFDYLIENNTLYAYTGTNNSWKWKMVQPVFMNRSAATIEIEVPLSALKATKGSVLQVGFMSNDNRARVFPALNTKLTEYTIK